MGKIVYFPQQMHPIHTTEQWLVDITTDIPQFNILTRATIGHLIVMLGCY